MMDFLLPLAAKSLLIAGVTLLVLKAMQNRSAADRSWIAHLGLVSIAVLPIALLLLPQLQIAAPWLAPEPVAVPAAPLSPVMDAEVATSTATFPGSAEAAAASPVDWAIWAYAAPAFVLVLLTLIALLRLVLLKSKANVLVEPNWLTALARAQRRMGFKHGTALLTSDDLRSPISWGLMRPVILLNSEAADAHEEAEAIIAHELAHVARLDWVKLLLSRVTVALFWFNPLVWLLAREAHQLREEAADDAVLGSDIEDTDYARLLVGIARHDCRGLLIGAHGVAPGRTSLARRVQRVLDAASARAPGGWRWTAAAAFFAAGLAVPLATLQLVPMTPANANASSVGGKAPVYVRSGAAISPVEAARSGDGLASATAGAGAAAVRVSDEPLPQDLQRTVVAARSNGATITSLKNGQTVLESPDGGTITSYKNGQTVLRSPSGAMIIVYPPDSSGRSRAMMKGPDGSIASYADARAVPGLAAAIAHPQNLARPPRPPLPPRPPRPLRDSDTAIDRAIELKALGASPDYVRSLRSAAPNLRLSHDDVVQLAALRVSPAYLRDLASSGYPNLDADDIAEARAMGITGAYIRAMSAAGYGRLSMDRLVELKAVGVTAEDVARYRRAGHGLPSLDRLVELKALGIDPKDVDPDYDP